MQTGTNYGPASTLQFKKACKKLLGVALLGRWTASRVSAPGRLLLSSEHQPRRREEALHREQITNGHIAKDPIQCIFGHNGKGQPNIQSTENLLTW